MTNWENAPEWAKFKAMDSNGWVYWFELQPVPSPIGWHTSGRLQLAGRPDWQTTIESRPVD